MFYINIQSWKHQPFVWANYQEETIAMLENQLERLATKEGHSSGIEWGLRQIVFERP